MARHLMYKPKYKLIFDGVVLSEKYNTILPSVNDIISYKRVKYKIIGKGILHYKPEIHLYVNKV